MQHGDASAAGHWRTWRSSPRAEDDQHDWAAREVVRPGPVPQFFHREFKKPCGRGFQVERAGSPQRIRRKARV